MSLDSDEYRLSAADKNVDGALVSGATRHRKEARGFDLPTVLPHRGRGAEICEHVFGLLTSAAADLANIQRGNIILFRWVVLGLAIKLARRLACDGHPRSGRNICVDMEGADGPIRLALHAGLAADAAVVHKDSAAA